LWYDECKGGKIGGLTVESVVRNGDCLLGMQLTAIFAQGTNLLDGHFGTE
jgi:hypothetical protein